MPQEPLPSLAGGTLLQPQRPPNPQEIAAQAEADAKAREEGYQLEKQRFVERRKVVGIAGDEPQTLKEAHRSATGWRTDFAGIDAARQELLAESNLLAKLEADRNGYSLKYVKDGLNYYRWEAPPKDAPPEIVQKDQFGYFAADKTTLDLRARYRGEVGFFGGAPIAEFARAAGGGIPGLKKFFPPTEARLAPEEVGGGAPLTFLEKVGSEAGAIVPMYGAGKIGGMVAGKVVQVARGTAGVATELASLRVAARTGRAGMVAPGGTTTLAPSGLSEILHRAARVISPAGKDVGLARSIVEKGVQVATGAAGAAAATKWGLRLSAEEEERINREGARAGLDEKALNAVKEDAIDQKAKGMAVFFAVFGGADALANPLVKRAMAKHGLAGARGAELVKAAVQTGGVLAANPEFRQAVEEGRYDDVAASVVANLGPFAVLGWRAAGREWKELRTREHEAAMAAQPVAAKVVTGASAQEPVAETVRNLVPRPQSMIGRKAQETIFNLSASVKGLGEAVKRGAADEGRAWWGKLTDSLRDLSEFIKGEHGKATLEPAAQAVEEAGKVIQDPAATVEEIREAIDGVREMLPAARAADPNVEKAIRQAADLVESTLPAEAPAAAPAVVPSEAEILRAMGAVEEKPFGRPEPPEEPPGAAAAPPSPPEVPPSPAAPTVAPEAAVEPGKAAPESLPDLIERWKESTRESSEIFEQLESRHGVEAFTKGAVPPEEFKVLEEAMSRDSKLAQTIDEEIGRRAISSSGLSGNEAEVVSKSVLPNMLGTIRRMLSRGERPSSKQLETWAKDLFYAIGEAQGFGREVLVGLFHERSISSIAKATFAQFPMLGKLPTDAAKKAVDVMGAVADVIGDIGKPEPTPPEPLALPVTTPPEKALPAPPTVELTSRVTRLAQKALERAQRAVMEAGGATETIPEGAVAGKAVSQVSDAVRAAIGLVKKAGGLITPHNALVVQESIGKFVGEARAAANTIEHPVVQEHLVRAARTGERAERAVARLAKWADMAGFGQDVQRGSTPLPTEWDATEPEKDVRFWIDLLRGEREQGHLSLAVLEPFGKLGKEAWKSTFGHRSPGEVVALINRMARAPGDPKNPRSGYSRLMSQIATWTSAPEMRLGLDVVDMALAPANERILRLNALARAIYGKRLELTSELELRKLESAAGKPLLYRIAETSLPTLSDAQDRLLLLFAKPEYGDRTPRSFIDEGLKIGKPAMQVTPAMFLGDPEAGIPRLLGPDATLDTKLRDIRRPDWMIQAVKDWEALRKEVVEEREIAELGFDEREAQDIRKTDLDARAARLQDPKYRDSVPMLEKRVTRNEKKEAEKRKILDERVADPNPPDPSFGKTRDEAIEDARRSLAAQESRTGRYRQQLLEARAALNEAIVGGRMAKDRLAYLDQMTRDVRLMDEENYFPRDAAEVFAAINEEVARTAAGEEKTSLPAPPNPFSIVKWDRHMRHREGAAFWERPSVNKIELPKHMAGFRDTIFARLKEAEDFIATSKANRALRRAIWGKLGAVGGNWEALQHHNSHVAPVFDMATGQHAKWIGPHEENVPDPIDPLGRIVERKRTGAWFQPLLPNQSPYTLTWKEIQRRLLIYQGGLIGKGYSEKYLTSWLSQVSRAMGGYVEPTVWDSGIARSINNIMDFAGWTMRLALQQGLSAAGTTTQIVEQTKAAIAGGLSIADIAKGTRALRAAAEGRLGPEVAERFADVIGHTGVLGDTLMLPLAQEAPLVRKIASSLAGQTAWLGVRQGEYFGRASSVIGAYLAEMRALAKAGITGAEAHRQALATTRKWYIFSQLSYSPIVTPRLLSDPVGRKFLFLASVPARYVAARTYLARRSIGAIFDAAERAAERATNQAARWIIEPGTGRRILLLRPRGTDPYNVKERPATEKETRERRTLLFRLEKALAGRREGLVAGLILASTFYGLDKLTRWLGSDWGSRYSFQLTQPVLPGALGRMEADARSRMLSVIFKDPWTREVFAQIPGLEHFQIGAGPVAAVGDALTLLPKFVDWLANTDDKGKSLVLQQGMRRWWNDHSRYRAEADMRAVMGEPDAEGNYAVFDRDGRLRGWRSKDEILRSFFLGGLSTERAEDLAYAREARSLQAVSEMTAKAWADAMRRAGAKDGLAAAGLMALERAQATGGKFNIMDIAMEFVRTTAMPDSVRPLLEPGKSLMETFAEARLLVNTWGNDLSNPEKGRVEFQLGLAAVAMKVYAAEQRTDPFGIIVQTEGRRTLAYVIAEGERRGFIERRGEVPR